MLFWRAFALAAILAVLSASAMAHGVGGSQAANAGEHVVEFKYSELEPDVTEAVVLTFALKNSVNDVVKPEKTWITITRESGELMFAGSIRQDANGKASFTYLFPEQGKYALKASFESDVEKLSEAEFELEVKEAEDANQNSVIITDEGFEPELLEVEEGATVTWANEGTNLRWPASDIHPTHTKYPGSGIQKCGTEGDESILDSCRMLEPGEQYSFTFDEPGTWGVHDHVNPALTMRVKVTASNEKEAGKTEDNERQSLLGKIFSLLLQKILSKEDSGKPESEKEGITVREAALAAMSACSDENRPGAMDKVGCYAQEFQEIAYDHGTEFGFEAMFELQRHDPAAKTCHLITHGIGWGTYKKAPEKWQEHIATINTACVYGGIHGVLEQYVADLPSGTLTEEAIPEICKANPKPACFHALGHVVALETRDNLSEASEMCSVLPPENRQRHYCLTGVFMEHMIADNLVQHGFYPLERRQRWWTHIDEFEELCRSLEGEDAIACWTEIVHASAITFRGDPKKVFGLCESAQLEEAKKRCKRHSISELVAKNGGNIMKVKEACMLERERDTEFERDCYTGLVTTKLFIARPEEMKEVMAFCNSLEMQFKDSCFAQIGRILRERSISPQAIAGVCRNAPEEFQATCTGPRPMLRNI